MKIDIHTHFIPPDFIEQARRGAATDDIKIEQRDGQEWVIHPQGFQYPLLAEFHELDAKLKHMDGLGIDISVLSVSPTLLFHWTEAEPAKEFCRSANEAMAQFVAQSGDRLYGMAAVPLRDPEAAADELRRAVTQLDLRGVQIGTTMEEIPLDDEQFDPFFTTAAELNVPVVLHPYYVGTKPEFAEFYMTNLVANPLETGVAATRLILSGCLDKHPTLTFILVHAGGFMPYQIGRLDHGYKVRKETSAKIDAPPSSYLRRFYFDTITHAMVPLKFLVNLVGADRVVIGTDIPFDMQDLNFSDYLAETGLDEQSLVAINESNASRIFGVNHH
jgi:aminocarboxymuconate-semialdehyde decarboxylase